MGRMTSHILLNYDGKYLKKCLKPPTSHQHHSSTSHQHQPVSIPPGLPRAPSKEGRDVDPRMSHQRFLLSLLIWHDSADNEADHLATPIGSQGKEGSYGEATFQVNTLGMIEHIPHLNESGHIWTTEKALVHGWLCVACLFFSLHDVCKSFF